MAQSRGSDNVAFLGASRCSPYPTLSIHDARKADRTKPIISDNLPSAARSSLVTVTSRRRGLRHCSQETARNSKATSGDGAWLFHVVKTILSVAARSASSISSCRTSAFVPLIAIRQHPSARSLGTKHSTLSSSRLSTCSQQATCSSRSSTACIDSCVQDMRRRPTSEDVITPNFRLRRPDYSSG